MKRFIGLLIMIVLTTAGMALFTVKEENARGNLVSKTKFFDIPVLSVNTTDAFQQPALIVVGAPGTGVLYVGAVGIGVVSIGFASLGLLFGVGQGSAGLISFGQMTLGPVFAMGQLAFGYLALGQAAVGVRSRGQGSERRNGMAFMKSLSKELNEALRFDWRGRTRKPT